MDVNTNLSSLSDKDRMAKSLSLLLQLKLNCQLLTLAALIKVINVRGKMVDNRLNTLKILALGNR